MTPEMEAKINKIHDTVLVMTTQWETHQKNHPIQPCSDMKEMRRDIWKAAGVAILSLLGVIYQFLIGSK